jgi:putative transposase
MHRRQSNPWATLGQPAWANALADALHLSDSPALRRNDLARCLLLASCLNVSLSAVARPAAHVGRETLRKALAAELPGNPRDLEARLAAALRRQLPRVLRRRPIPLAIDLHRRPFYGDHAATPGVRAGKSDRSTGWFWTFATAVALTPGHRHTLALSSVPAGEGPAAVVERLLAQVGWAGIEVDYVLLDREFYTAGVIDALTRRRLRFIIPVVRRGQAVERFFRRGNRGWFDHRLQSRWREHDVAVRIAVVPGADGRRPWVFACSEGFDRLPRVALRYRERFGIESSYRQLGECLARTTSVDPVYRLVLVGVSLLIRAWWLGVVGVELGQLRWMLIVTLSGVDRPTPLPATQTSPPPQPTTS